MMIGVVEPDAGPWFVGRLGGAGMGVRSMLVVGGPMFAAWTGIMRAVAGR